MKTVEDSFPCANQLGQREGARAVYLNVHRPDIMLFLDIKREIADKKSN
jgi:ribonucleoside-diphosphate reductase alpha chain